ncbi:MAG: hypothetical protein WAZ18_07210 [Alphaproteobacteria bacterium]
MTYMNLQSQARISETRNYFAHSPQVVWKSDTCTEQAYQQVDWVLGHRGFHTNNLAERLRASDKTTFRDKAISLLNEAKTLLSPDCHEWRELVDVAIQPSAQHRMMSFSEALVGRVHIQDAGEWAPIGSCNDVAIYARLMRAKMNEFQESRLITLVRMWGQRTCEEIVATRTGEPGVGAESATLMRWEEIWVEGSLGHMIQYFPKDSNLKAWALEARVRKENPALRPMGLEKR